MAKRKKATRRAVRGAAGLAVGTLAVIVGVAAYKQGEVLNLLPNGFEDFNAGRGKGALSNRRVQIMAAATVGCMAFKRYKKYAPVAALGLGLAARQHNVTYNAEVTLDELGVETYADASSEEWTEQQVETYDKIDMAFNEDAPE